MPMIPRPGRITRILPIAALLAVIGCSSGDSRDERLAEVTRRALEEQTKQNKYIADQAKSVAEQSRDVTETAKELVTKDAEARREMIEATQKLNSGLHNERRNIDRQQEKLDDERKQIAANRHRDPIIATALESFGLMLACLLPLLVCIFVLRQMQDETGDEKALAELLALEITSDQPTLLPVSPLGSPRLEDQEPEEFWPDPAGDDDPNEMEEPPF